MESGDESWRSMSVVEQKGEKVCVPAYYVEVLNNLRSTDRHKVAHICRVVRKPGLVRETENHAGGHDENQPSHRRRLDPLLCVGERVLEE